MGVRGAQCRHCVVRCARRRRTHRTPMRAGAKDEYDDYP
jgi:aldehyde:ferredoxin oxidoreductase